MVMFKFSLRAGPGLSPEARKLYGPFAEEEGEEEEEDVEEAQAQPGEEAAVAAEGLWRIKHSKQATWEQAKS